MNKLAKIIKELDYDDLKLLKKDLTEGNMETLINMRLKTFEESNNYAVCPICNTEINDTNNGALTLFFGEKSFRRKANFDAIDCLQYFIEHLKKINEKKIRKGVEANGSFRDYKNI